ncbi:hypothetical protein, partial [Nocardia tengchongensis]|uniref:hypothetical protein n=1 Tax=Nocardia tengchongensis TaxID=2055889 RepID=UPI00369851EB
MSGRPPILAVKGIRFPSITRNFGTASRSEIAYFAGRRGSATNDMHVVHYETVTIDGCVQLDTAVFHQILTPTRALTGTGPARVILFEE